MRKIKLSYFIIAILLIAIMSGCSQNEIDVGSDSLDDNKSNTTQEAVEYFLREKLSSTYLEGDRFFSTYRIMDEIKTEESVVVFSHFLCKWMSSGGGVVSDGAGLVSITFDIIDDALAYKAHRHFDGQEIPTSSDIPQKVKDSYASDAPDSYFPEMRTEIENDIAEYLQ